MLDPRELARSGGMWSGQVPVVSFERAAPILDNDDGDVAVRLTFDIDPEGRLRMSGSADVAANIRCHRCLRKVATTVAASINVALVRSEAQAQELTRDVDTMVLVEDTVTIQSLVEDDLILSIPERVCDAANACRYAPKSTFTGSGSGTDKDEEVAPAGGRRDNAFAALAELKGRLK